MDRILIADVDKNLGIVLKRELEDEGYAADLVRHLGFPTEGGAWPGYAVVILGMLVPSLDVFSRLRGIKRNNPSSHIIFFSDTDATDETTSFIDAGADTCFARHEIFKLKAHLRRYLTAGRCPA